MISSTYTIKTTDTSIQNRRYVDTTGFVFFTNDYFMSSFLISTLCRCPMQRVSAAMTGRYVKCDMSYLYSGAAVTDRKRKLMAASSPTTFQEAIDSPPLTRQH